MRPRDPGPVSGPKADLQGMEAPRSDVAGTQLDPVHNRRKHCTALAIQPFFLPQVYDERDYRQIRFVSRQKEVNENFAIDLVAEQPVSEVESRVISCDGGGGALGHPRVYINLDKETKTGTCGYCGLQFKQHHH
ncbi:NADH dehydrogenase [ubiquinone] iron-sulfur protein 6, mitochondrial [Echinops telfairi]|uniref:NADH dehydrogenase [ubiquinone] iron-sulfur protein 6, mitochondrial n=1 Tax=Echinops telfairi TaxID=9371 RepID=A0AC55CPZ0_ECHTE|nr:NADH dehydrogenase [ubiquinone] iron-sulfur protein 6, mitochondrial [Echinops telfairi]